MAYVLIRPSMDEEMRSMLVVKSSRGWGGAHMFAHGNNMSFFPAALLSWTLMEFGVFCQQASLKTFRYNDIVFVFKNREGKSV